MLLLVMLLLGPHGADPHPAIKAALSSKGLQYGVNTATSWLQEKAKVTELPEISGNVDIGIGSVDYDLNGITVARLDMAQPDVAFQQGSGVRVDVTGVSVAVTGQWHTSFSIIRDSGSFDAALFDVGVSSVLLLGSDSQGRPSIQIDTCDSQIGDIQISFHGGASFIFQPFVDHFKGQIKGKIVDQICPSLNEGIGSLEAFLAAMNVSYHVDPSLFLDVPLTNAPLVQDSEVEFDLKGVFYSEADPLEPPFPSQEFPMARPADRMLAMAASEFCLNSYAYACLRAGLLQTLITDSMIPDMSPIRLNTSSFGALIPQLPKIFPNMLMELQVYAGEAPTVSLQPSVFALSLTAGIKASAVLPNSTLAPLFTLKLATGFSGKLSLSDAKLTGVLQLDNSSLAVDSSEIGPFQTQSLESVLNSALKIYVVPKMNGILNDGIPLPGLRGVSLQNPVLQIQQGFLAVVSDIIVGTELHPHTSPVGGREL